LCFGTGLRNIPIGGNEIRHQLHRFRSDRGISRCFWFLGFCGFFDFSVACRKVTTPLPPSLTWTIAVRGIACHVLLVDRELKWRIPSAQPVFRGVAKMHPLGGANSWIPFCSLALDMISVPCRGGRPLELYCHAQQNVAPILLSP